MLYPAELPARGGGNGNRVWHGNLKAGRKLAESLDSVRRSRQHGWSRIDSMQSGEHRQWASKKRTTRISRAG